MGNRLFSAIIRQKLLGLAKQKRNVVISDTNINKQLRRRLYSDLFDMGFEISVVDMTSVQLEELFMRNEQRPKDEQVPDDVVERMFNNATKQQDDIREEVEVLNYRYEKKHPEFHVVCDIDGTVAERTDRSPFEWHRVGEDAMKEKVVLGILQTEEIECMHLNFFSGRDTVRFNDTHEWLIDNGFSEFTLTMRDEGSQKADWIVKGKMMIDFIESGKGVYLVFDDRQQVVNIWKNMGLDVIQVDQGRF